MATSRPKPSTLDQIRSLLTAAEQQVLHSSMGAAVAKASREQVEAAISRARALRNKWRDLHADQTRSTKRSPSARSGVNQRSREKLEVFDGALKRLEARLAEFAGGVRAAVGKQAARLTAAGNPRKSARTAASRVKRASVRSELKDAVSEINRKRQPKPAKAAAKPAAIKPAATVAAKPVAAKAAEGATVARKGKVKKRTKPVPPAAVAAQKKFKFDVAGQRSARTAASAARLKFDGAKTRRGGHLAASVKRSQARRDGRPR
jgi:hypothetical protein